jgi:hypothetical protein
MFARFFHGELVQFMSNEKFVTTRSIENAKNIKCTNLIDTNKEVANKCDYNYSRKIYILRSGSFIGGYMEKTEIIKVPVITFEQKGIRNYVGVMKARDILDVWQVDRFIENQCILRGYQRQEEENRMREVYKYVEECQIPIIPAILASVRMGSFKKTYENFGILELPRIIGALEIVDGQHRIGGFWVIKRLIEGEKIGRRRLAEEEISRLDSLLDFEIPVHFIDAQSAVKRMEELTSPEVKENMLKELNKESLGPEDVERVHFFVINKTQKAIRPSLKETLAYLICASGIKGIPIIEKERWKADIATPLALDLHFVQNSPLRGMINISGARGLGRPVQLASFVKSLEPLAKNVNFVSLERPEQLDYLKVYWSTIAKLLPAAFQMDTYKDYLILKTLGVYVLNRLANDIFNWCLAKGVKKPSESDIMPYLKPLREFNWKKDSPIASYGGQKGVRRAYEEVIKFLADHGILEAQQRYMELTVKKGE